MKKALVVLVAMVLGMALYVSLSAQPKDRKIRLVTREISLERVHPSIVWETLVVSPNSKRFAYWAVRGGKWFVVVDGKKGKEYDGFLIGIS